MKIKTEILLNCLQKLTVKSLSMTFRKEGFGSEAIMNFLCIFSGGLRVGTVNRSTPYFITYCR